MVVALKLVVFVKILFVRIVVGKKLRMMEPYQI